MACEYLQLPFLITFSSISDFVLQAVPHPDKVTEVVDRRTSGPLYVLS